MTWLLVSNQAITYDIKVLLAIVRLFLGFSLVRSWFREISFVRECFAEAITILDVVELTRESNLEKDSQNCLWIILLLCHFK